MMGDLRDSNSVVSVTSSDSSDHHDRTDEITTETVIARPQQPHYTSMSSSRSHGEVSIGGFHDKDMSEDYFMSVNQHKKSLR